MSNSLRKSARNGLITHTVMSQGETSDEDEDVIHTMESSKRAKTSPHESFSTISPIPGGSNYHPAEIFGSECGHQHPNQQQHPQPQRISGISHGQLPPRGDEWNDRRLTEWNDRVNTMINEFAVEPDVHNLTKLYERYLEGRSGNGRGGGYPLARFLKYGLCLCVLVLAVVLLSIGVLAIFCKDSATKVENIPPLVSNNQTECPSCIYTNESASAKTFPILPSVPKMQVSKFTTYNHRSSTTAPILTSPKPLPFVPALPSVPKMQNIFDCPYHRRSSSHSKVYQISLPNHQGKFSAYCRMDGDSKVAWTILQRRTNPTLPFWNATFDQYARGFGDPSDDHWFGLEKFYGIQTAYGSAPLLLRIELEGDFCKGRTCSTARIKGPPYWWGEWLVKISARDDFFRLDQVQFLRGNLSFADNDPFKQLNQGMSFSTVDEDHDTIDQRNCASMKQHGGWWHKDCTYVALNGAYNEENSSPRAERQFWHWMPANKSIPGTYNIKPRKSVILFRPS